MTKLQVDTILHEMTGLRDIIHNSEKHQHNLLIVTFSITSAFLILMFYYQAYTIALFAPLVLLLIGVSFAGEMINIAEVCVYYIEKEKELNSILGGRFATWEYYAHSPPRKLWGATYRYFGFAGIFAVLTTTFAILGAVLTDLDFSIRIVVATGYLIAMVVLGIRAFSHIKQSEHKYYRGVFKRPNR